MKKINLFLIFAVFFFSNQILFGQPLTNSIQSNSIDTNNFKLTIDEARISKLKDTVFNREKCLIAHCPVTLVNNSDDTLKYLAMSASWWDLYSIDNPHFALAADYWNVFKNGPKILVLPPHTSRTRMIPIITNKAYHRGEKLRIAMSVQSPGPLVNLEPKTINMIWSNEVIIH